MIKVICVGKIKDSNLKSLIDDYYKRIIKYTSIQIIELKDENENYDEMKKESKEIENYLDSKSYNIALDRLGKNIDSINFSKLIDKTFISYPNINFIIGGSLGIDKSILDKCNIVLSFSSLTFPHQLFRLMLLEQIYRSFKILNNERYHK
ncbi:MAG: 23S rRNA (pseudouridine(1915)-N(3))-methyltransferase RlmH [Clostridiales bacterium]|jgi:ribosomal RNA large subunit methyltransferase H|nr:23S rRNA (pseudouridine(1915)-N(3))-methyltransferase RlmH [Clostridiales bacterium]